MAAASGISILLIYTHAAEVGDSLTLSRLRLLRLSITGLCNFRCRYCMPAGGMPRIAFFLWSVW